MVAFMSRITTHVLDTVLGRPATGIAVVVAKQEQDGWTEVAGGETDQDGRCAKLILDAGEGLFRLTFRVGAYFAKQGRTTIYPEISITFRCSGESHYHLPLLLSDNSYTTYRGT
jgi:5-hydroxyisourate hydrolase